MRLLSHQYKNIAAASTEIINLQSIVKLSKGAEHFLAGIHGRRISQADSEAANGEMA